MKNGSFKRLLSGVLASTVLAVGIPAAFAKEYEDVSETNPARDQIDILSDIGVILGTSDKTFSPDDAVTREQMALLLFRLMLNKADGGRVNTSPFRDLYDDTYHGAISWANAAGYILGTSESTFEPQEGIMLQDAMAMLVRALGQASDTMNKGYPWTYIDAAIKLGLDRGLENLAYTEPLTRGETAIILFNALTAEYLVPKTLSNGMTVYESTTIIEKVFGYEMDTATIVATNDYSLNGTTVIKNGFVTLSYSDDNGNERLMTVDFSELGLSGKPNDYLGRSFKVMYTVNGSSRPVNVLSAVETGDTESYSNATVNATKGYVTIGGTNYTVVEKYSDALATNSNELLVFAYENDRTLTQIKTLDALNERLGLYQIELIFRAGSDTASVAILRNFQIGQLKVDGNGKINLAGNLKIDELSGGYTNKVGAENGEYVLYYFNSQTRELLIQDVLDIVSGIVTRITGTSAKIGGESYTLGNAKAGIQPSAIAALLTIGAKAQAAVYNGSILAVVGETVLTARSEYLVALSASLPVFANGEFRYVVTANIDGTNQNIYVNLRDVEAGKVYRYVRNGDLYTLISPETDGNGMIQTGLNKFVQNGFGTSEIAAIIDSASGTTISKGGHTYFTLTAGQANIQTSQDGSDELKFVTDNETTIVVVKDGQLQYRHGVYNSAFTVADGARVVAVFKNEVGSVETLRYLYISDGSLGNYDATAQTVRILALSGIVYENNTTYIEYQVFNYATGEVESRLTTAVGLTVGELYAIGSDGTIVNVPGTVQNGSVVGYTESTVSIGTETYAINADTKIVALDSQLNVKQIKLSDTFEKRVDFVVSNGAVTLILVK